MSSATAEQTGGGLSSSPNRGRTALIVNTRARRGAQAFAEAKRLLAQRGVVLDATYPVQDPARLPELVALAVAQAYGLIIVGGGDGTISSVVDAFAYTKTVLGILPLGTANSFARGIGIPLDLAGAVGVLVDGRETEISLGKVNDDCFANAATIGLAVGIARRVPHRLKRLFGRAGYLMAAGALLASFRAFHCTISIPGVGQRSFDAALEVRIHNGPYKGGMLVAREATVHSPSLVIQVIKGRSPRRLMKVWAELAAGMRPPEREQESLTAEEFTLEVEPLQYVSIDGEVVTRTPIHVSVAPQALRVMVPREENSPGAA